MATTGNNANWMRVHQQWGVLDTDEKPGFSPSLYNVEANKQCKSITNAGAHTVIEALEQSKEKYGQRRAAGWREVVKVHEVEESPGGPKREKIELENEFKWMTYAEYHERIYSLASGLASIGVQPRSKLVIYAETQRDWMATAFAAWYNGAEIVTIYATLGEEGAIHGINETEAATVVADAKLLKVLTKILPKCVHIKNIVTVQPCDADLKGVGVYNIDQLVVRGKENTGFKPIAVHPEDVAVIMYTSGTTAAPKGVMITHGNLVATLSGVEHVMGDVMTADDVYLCYLPLAHIFEMGAEIWALATGMALGFGSPHTLTDSGVKLKRPESRGDAVCLQPTFMVFAPAVLDKVYQSVQTKRDTLKGIGKCLFDCGLNSGERHFGRGQVGANRFYNGLVFKKVQQLVGGRLKCMITGSAPLSPEIQKFVQTVLDAPVRQGYGLTETCAGSCAAFWGDNQTSSVGPPTVCAVIRLADWAEGNYMNSDKDKPEIGMRRGEVLIGGPCVTKGYFVNPACPNAELEKKNKEDWEVIDGVRFFRTGDVGQIRPDGTLQIIDRKKDLWKGPQGEYVALSKVEAALKLCEYVEMPMVYGKTGGTYPIALICPQKPRIMALGQELNLTDASFEKLCSTDQVIEKVAAACKAQCKAQRLAEFETPKKFALIAELWTPENEMLTAAMKLKRPIIASHHKAIIDRLY